MRSPIVSVLGHVDHGKSSILDAIRGSNITSTEAGAITQAIGASKVPLEAIKKRCGPLLDKLDLTIPGLLFIDTPGHAAFTSLRKRGGALADIAILVVDLNEGFQPQTKEAVEILRNSKTPFIIAANKVDLVPGYRKTKKYLLQDISSQAQQVQKEIDNRLYTLLGELHKEFEMNAERFDRVDDYTKQIAIVPCSAKKEIGISELLMVISGLAQKFLEERLQVDVSGPARGTILEVKEDKGLGTTIDVIIYDGTINVNDTIVIGAVDEPIVVKVRILLEPDAMAEMRDKRSKFNHVKSASAATGVKISAPGMEDAMAGMPVLVATNLEEAKQKVQEELESVLIEEGSRGIVVKTDSIGSLEALLQILKEKEVPVARASVGKITKKDIAVAEGSYEKDPLHGVILGFNVAKVDAGNITVLASDIIYKLIEDFEAWQIKSRKNLEFSQLEGLIRPCKIEFLKNHTFRQSNPAVIGIEVLNGILKPNTPLMKQDRSRAGIVKSMQTEKESLSEAGKGKQIALSIKGVTVGRQINEGDILFAAIPEKDFRKLKDVRKCLSKDDILAMKEFVQIMREQNPVWGV